MSSRNQIVLAIAAILIGCCCNVLTLELIVHIDPGCGTMVTFLQFFVVALYGFPRQLERCDSFPYVTIRARRVPLIIYILMVLLFMSSSVLNNAVFAFDVSLPLNTIFRSSSMVCTMILNYLICNRRYSRLQLISVIMVTAGVITVTFSNTNERTDLDTSFFKSTQAVGLLMLVVGLLLSSSLGLVQEWCRNKYHQDSKESQFYYHLLSLPCFIVLWSTLQNTSMKWFDLQFYGPHHYDITIGEWSFVIPIIYVYVLGNVTTQLVCISGVFKLISLTSSLTLQVVISLRKFISLMLSIIYFGHAFTSGHWVGTILAFGGGLLYGYASSIAAKKKVE